MLRFSSFRPCLHCSCRGCCCYCFDRYALNNLRVVPAHCVFMMYFSLAYCLFSWAYFYCNGYFFYFFLDFRNEKSYLAYGIIPLVLTALHLILSFARH